MPVFIVVGNNYAEEVVFKRVVYAKDRNAAVSLALFEENRSRPFDDQLMRSKMFYNVRTITDFVPELDEPEAANVSDNQDEQSGVVMK